MKVDIKVSGLNAVLKQVENLDELVKSGPGVHVMTEIGKAGMEDIDARFATAGYGTWKPLSPVTVSRKGHSKILIDTENMRNAVGIGRVTEKKVTVTVPYGGRNKQGFVPSVHQQGAVLPSGAVIPQRKIVEITDKLLNRIRPIVMNWAKSWRY